jgi:hypothetical protein
MAKPAIETTEAGLPRHPYYRGLVLRRHAKDLADWCDRAEQMYRPMGGQRVGGNTPRFRFPGGEIIYTGHLKDLGAVYHYLGSQYHQILIEELTLIPTVDFYIRLLGSLRSIHLDLPAQIMSTTNPGGPGHGWVRSRFVRVYDENGLRVPSGTPFKGKDGNWRIFVPAKVEDNPILMERDPGYVAYLDDLPEALRKAWRAGDWDSFAGQFFDEFRPEGPIGNEKQKYPWANHVLADPPELKPWWHRWMSGDWGYDHPSVIHWYCQHGESDQIHVYKELYVRQVSPVQLGVSIAETAAEDLYNLPGRHMTLSLDPKAWAKTDEGKTIAQRINEGIDIALGKGTAMLMDSNDLPVEHGRQLEPGKATIVVRQAANQRVAGWQAVREVLRFKPLFGSGNDEILPVLQIHGEACPYLIDTLPVLVFDEKQPEDAVKMNAVNGFGGDDPADSLRYGVMAWKARRNRVPLEVYMAEQMAKLDRKYHGNPDPTIVDMVAAFHIDKYKRGQTVKPAVHRRLARPIRGRIRGTT